MPYRLAQGSYSASLVDDCVLPEYHFLFDEMAKGETMSVILFLAGKPAIAENMILSSSVVLRENAVHRCSADE
ncbi:hypothetical protein GKE29_26065 [Escherichia coli]|jgi:hypothetical protein|nr:hypothetical protein [Escherichia coli]RYT94006.1 hypothetical protein EAJ17_12890 [Akkermansia sp. aa_0143]